MSRVLGAGISWIRNSTVADRTLPGLVDIISPGIISIPPLCINPIYTDTFNIGILSAGSYQVRVWIVDDSGFFPEPVLVASAPLTVTQGPAAHPIPTLATSAFFVAAFLLLLSALPFVRRRSGLR